MMNEKIINQDIGVNEQDIQQDIGLNNQDIDNINEQDVNIPTQPTNPLNKMFIPLPNNLMSYSLSENHWVLPVYMYSFTRKSSVNPIEPNMVETTLGLMSEIFCPNEDSRRGIGNKIGEALNILYNGVEGKFSPVISLCDTEDSIDFAQYTKSSLLRYTVDRVQSRTGFLKLNYDEYFKLENLNRSLGYAKNREADGKGKCIYNIVELMNLYVYLKSRASLYCNINEKKYGRYIGINNTKIHDSISTISNELRIGNKTCAMYLNQLEKIGMIRIFRGKEEKLKTNFGASENMNSKATTNAKANYYMINYDWRM